MTGTQGWNPPGMQADYAPLSPLSFLARTVAMHPQRLAVAHGAGDQIVKRTWLQLYARCGSLACALKQEGIGKGDVVAVMLPNTPAMVEAGFAIPMAGAVFCALDPRQEPSVIAKMLDDSGAKAILVDAEFAESARDALDLRRSGHPVFVIDVVDPVFEGAANPVGDIGYEEFLAQGDPAHAWKLPQDENDAIALSYSGVDGCLESFLCSHRGAAISALAMILEWDMPRHASYLWTQPMPHGNGWSLSWSVAARAGVNVCLRDGHFDRAPELIGAHGVTHYCGPANVHARLQEALSARQARDAAGLQGMVAGDPPVQDVILGLERQGVVLTHAQCLPRTCGLSVRVDQAGD
ncbi:AMP-binding protein [Paracandidimonas soli]|uniref:AMP-binding protein n=1 Tax=Paracandidimonas soli TaxID=1917182 RepID=UPI00333EA5C2